MVYTEGRGEDVDELDLAYESFDELVDLYGVTVSGDADFRNVSAADNVRIPRAQIGGAFYGGNLETDVFNAARSEVGEDLYLNGADIAYNTILREVNTGGAANLNRGHFGSAFIEHSAFEEGISAKDAVFDGTFFLNDVETPFVDLRGFNGNLVVDDLDEYTFLVEDSLSNETWVGTLSETDAVEVSLTDKEREWYDKVLERPLYPPDRRDGCVFTVDDLRRDFVIDDERRGLLGSLTQKGAVYRVDDEHYLARSDVL